MGIRLRLLIGAVFVGLLGAATTSVLGKDGPRAPRLGEAAPPVTADAWLNTPKEESPFPDDDYGGKVVMLEFWGTWCAPCVRAMPKVQALHESYSERGLVVVAVTRESASIAEPFLEAGGYTMPVACDTAQDTIESYAISSWPTTVVIDRDGSVAYVGAPAGAEAAVEEALGLETGPAALLSGYLTSQGGKQRSAERAALERLLEKSTDAFDLRTWAQGLAGPLPVGSRALEIDPGKSLDACARAWSAPAGAARAAALLELATSAPQDFDLRAWARERMGASFPLVADEVKELLAAHAYAKVVDALLDRKPSAAVVTLAAKDEGLQAHCATKAPEAHAFARKGLMVLKYVFGKASKVRAEDNEAFWADLSINGAMTTPDKQRIVGIDIGGAMIEEGAMPAYVERQLARHVLMGALAAGGKVKLASVTANAAKEKGRIIKALKRKYG